MGLQSTTMYSVLFYRVTCAYNPLRCILFWFTVLQGPTIHYNVFCFGLQGYMDLQSTTMYSILVYRVTWAYNPLRCILFWFTGLHVLTIHYDVFCFGLQGYMGLQPVATQFSA